MEYLTADQADDPASTKMVWDFTSATPPPISEVVEGIEMLRTALERSVAVTSPVVCDANGLADMWRSMSKSCSMSSRNSSRRSRRLSGTRSQESYRRSGSSSSLHEVRTTCIFDQN